MERLIRTAIMAGIGFAIGCVISYFVGGAVEIPWGVVFAGLPVGWCFIGDHLGHTFVYGGLIPVLAFYIFKIAASLLIGWIVLCVNIILGLYEVLSSSAEAAS